MGHIEGGHRWNVVTPLIPADVDPSAPRYDGGLDFTLTQSDKSRVAVAKAHLERQRRERNRAEANRAANEHVRGAA